MRARALVAVGACAAAFTGLLLAEGALARVEAESGYTKSQTYNGALRYLRVDRGFEVTERDPDAAYLLFRYRPPGRKEATGASVEIIEAEDEVKVFVQIPRMPRYHEKVLSDDLLEKLREEYGEPPPRKPEPPPSDDDAGAP